PCVGLPLPVASYPLPTLPATPISTLSLHDALPISRGRRSRNRASGRPRAAYGPGGGLRAVRPHRDRAPVAHPEDLRPAAACELGDRKSTRLNSSHLGISYAVFCLKKKKTRRRW